MTLTTHAIVGAAAASLFPTHPYAAFVAGFVSHLAIDALPHWDEGSVALRSMVSTGPSKLDRDMRLGWDFVLDLLYLGSEAVAGLVVAIGVLVLMIGIPLPIVLIGVAAGLLPDIIHFVYFKTRSVLLTDFQLFHAFIQNEKTDQRYLWVEAALVMFSFLVVFFTTVR